MSKGKNLQPKKKEGEDNTVDVKLEILKESSHQKIGFYASMPSENVLIVQESDNATFDEVVTKVINDSESSESLKGVLTLIPMHFKDYKKFLYTIDKYSIENLLDDESFYENIKGISVHDLYTGRIFTAGDYCVFIDYCKKSVTIFFLDNLLDDLTIFSSKAISLQLILKNVIRVGINEIKKLTDSDPYAIIVKNNPEWNTNGITQLEYLTILDINSSELKFSMGKDIDQTHIYIYMEKNNEISPLYGDSLNDLNKDKKSKKKKEGKKKKKK